MVAAGVPVGAALAAGVALAAAASVGAGPEATASSLKTAFASCIGGSVSCLT